MHYITIRNGEERQWVVLIHGLSGSSRQNQHQVEAYRRHFNLINLDLPGHGASPPLKKYSFEVLNREILAILDREGVGKAHFMALSLGTAILVGLVGAHPERVKSIVWAGAILGFSEEHLQLIYTNLRGGERKTEEELIRNITQIMEPTLFCGRSTGYEKELEKMGPREPLKWLGLMLRLRQVYPDFVRNSEGIPMLFISGERDVAYIDRVRTFCREQGKELHIIPQGRHPCNLFYPEAFNRISLDFLLRQVNSAPRDQGKRARPV